MSHGAAMLKEACRRKPSTEEKPGRAAYHKYLDTMQEDLNKNIQANIFPHWRNHPSLKGKTPQL